MKGQDGNATGRSCKRIWPDMTQDADSDIDMNSERESLRSIGFKTSVKYILWSYPV